MTKLILAIAAVSVALPALADVGPKPSAAFAIAFDKPGVTITGGELLQCKLASCADAKPLQALGPQRFVCEAAECYAMAYGFAPYARVRLVLSDGRSLSSNVFAIKAFNAKFQVVVRATALKVTSTR